MYLKLSPETYESYRFVLFKVLCNKSLKNIFGVLGHLFLTDIKEQRVTEHILEVLGTREMITFGCDHCDYLTRAKKEKKTHTQKKIDICH